ncbi:unnamed protein product [Anisakis simplex]|uniref:Animal hem peroxidase n=1 Tax=Anisakis simplex TaxID=6269 RepID=A0A0M3IZZ9_ANISI|nr:unnamed protein product [Anisakis simplex]
MRYEHVAFEVSLAVPRRLTPNNIMRDGCVQSNLPNPCAADICYHKNYRTFDGSCNNLRDSLKGAAFTPFIRLLPPDYDDRINAVSDSISRERPNPRFISRALLSSRRSIASRASSMLMQFGQFLSHDMSKNKLDGRCTCQGGSECISISLSEMDSRRHKSPCIPLKRSIRVCGTGIHGVPRQQMNLNTAFIDASQVYGSDAITQRKFRAGVRSGLSMIPIGGRMFPPMDGRNTFNTGDDRSNLFVGLAALHTVFVRLHNKFVSLQILSMIDSVLRTMNKKWDEDRLFQETRKVVGAIMQVITYQEFLPALLGSSHNKLIPKYTHYKPNTNPAISNEFAGAAYRLHGLIQAEELGLIYSLESHEKSKL